MTNTILLVDDDRDILRALVGYFERGGFATRTATDGNHAMSIINTETIALIILDLMLPDRDGWDITRAIRNHPRHANLPIIMLTARIGDSDKLLGLELGADDYITKPFNPQEVVARVKTVLRRANPTPIHILKIGELELNMNSKQASLAGQKLDLTPTEYAILCTLMKHPNYVFTRSELITRSLGYEYESIERTLDSHIRNLRKKIEPQTGNPRYIQTVYGFGYKMEGN